MNATTSALIFVVGIPIVVLVSSCGGSTESSDNDNGGGTPTVNLAFVTSVSGSGNLGAWPDANGKTGLAAGDAICQARAAAAGLDRAEDFIAWLSDETDDAYCRIHGLAGKRSANCGQVALPASAGPWVRTDGFPFAPTITELLDDGKVYTPVRLDEFGVAVTGPLYFTGTSADGSLRFLQFSPPLPPEIPAACVNWTSAASAATNVWSSGGSVDRTRVFWTSFWSSGCDIAGHLLCMHKGAGADLPAFAQSGKKAFVTSVVGNGDLGSWSDADINTGLAAGDAICQSRASLAGLANSGNFKAWLSDSSMHARDRIASDGPWVRIDGVPVATSKADLLDGSLLTSINVDENGVYRGGAAFSGSADDGSASGGNCSDWSSNDGAFVGTGGDVTNAGATWSDQNQLPCDGVRSLRCLED